MKANEVKTIRRQAAAWLALRQARGLTSLEASEFAHWLKDSRNAESFSQVESVWQNFDRLSDFPHPPGSSDPNYFARPKLQIIRFARPAIIAAAAAIAIGIFVWHKHPHPQNSATSFAATEGRFVHLLDGSEVELNSGAVIAEHFTPAERRVQLIRGEAHFTVAKNHARPFVVDANGVTVRAVGTQFDVRLGSAEVQVLITEGSVEVKSPSTQAQAARSAERVRTVTLTAGQRTVVSTSLAPQLLESSVEQLSEREIDRILAWQTSRLLFDNTPLSEVVARFNRHLSGQKEEPRLILGDSRVGSILLSGRIRSDNVESFVEALETSFGVSATRNSSGEIMLRANSTDSR